MSITNEIISSDYETNSHCNGYLPKREVIYWPHNSDHHWNKKKLHSCSEKTIKPLIQALSRGIEKRFGPVLGNEEYLLATAIIPQFKLNFLSDEQKNI